MASSGAWRLRELVQRLILASQSDSVEWKETDRPGSYMSFFNGPNIEIFSADSDGSAPYVLQIMNDQGAIIETVDSQDRYVWSGVSEDLSKLHELARRDATNVDDVLDTIMSNLPSLPAPKPPAQSDDSGFTDEPPF